jgi:nitrite reductase/ring-hydroxylating ferredoxin subunit
MATDRAIQAVEHQDWLEPLADRLQSTLSNAFAAAGPAGQEIANALHGRWLGHPLHPVLTDIPIGSWTAAAVLDALEQVTGNRALGRGADAAIGLGIIGALGAAITGLTDWRHTDGRARRLGLAHGLLNTGALALYTTSMILRQFQARRAGRGVAALGYVVANTAAYLGGHLVFGEQIGVDHTAAQVPPAEFVPVLPEAELPENELRQVLAHGMPVLLLRRGDQIAAIAGTCSHLGGPLVEGSLEDCSVVCPWHGSRFALDSGAVLHGPATFPQPCFETRVWDGQIEVRAARR